MSGFPPISNASVNGNTDMKTRRYKSKWVRSVTRMKRMPKIMLKYRPNGQRRTRRPLKRLIYEAETGLSRLNSWEMMMMMMMTTTTTTTTTMMVIMMLIHKNFIDEKLSQNSIISLHWTHKFSFNHSLNPHSVSLISSERFWFPFSSIKFRQLYFHLLKIWKFSFLYTKEHIVCRL